MSAELRLPCVKFLSADLLPLESFSSLPTDHARPDTPIDATPTTLTSTINASSPDWPLEGATQISDTRVGVIVPPLKRPWSSASARKSSHDLKEAISNLEQADSREQVEKWIMAQSEFMETKEEGAEEEAEKIAGAQHDDMIEEPK